MRAFFAPTVLLLLALAFVSTWGMGGQVMPRQLMVSDEVSYEYKVYNGTILFGKKVKGQTGEAKHKIGSGGIDECIGLCNIMTKCKAFNYFEKKGECHFKAVDTKANPEKLVPKPNVMVYEKNIKLNSTDITDLIF